MLSEENKERINKAVDIGRTVMMYGWVPLIIVIGMRQSNPQPSFIRLISPLA
ncbi:tom7-domain-containing protein [Phaffia rhodozyma]|uniref:Tom7-domain-containing protein n=1 Tax=Phaffia rhodozyma TaxID=264483 RepID=A0A0F7SIN3_PHARH|nr:tom7-domain-containing protein [Phaffia rhodozyma]